MDAYAVLCKRLAPVIGRLTALGVEASVKAWADVAADPSSYLAPDKALAEQTIIWRDLLLTGRDPLTLVDFHVLEKASRRVGPLVRAFSAELIFGAVATVVLGLSVFYFSRLPGTLGTVLGAFGLTTSALAARTKAMVQTVGSKVHDAIYEDVVLGAVCRLPEMSS